MLKTIVHGVRRRSSALKIRHINLFFALIFSLVAAVAVAVVAANVLAPLLNIGQQETPPADLTRLSLTVAAGVGGVVALVVAYRRQRDLEQGKFVEGFGAAAMQLGDADAAVRLAGVYAMAGVADRSSKQQRQQCIDVLCGYLRLPYSPEFGNNHQLTRTLTQQLQGADGSTEEAHFQFRQNDRVVRQTIVRVIAAHLQMKSTHSWSDNDFDFTGAHLEDPNFENAVFNGNKTLFNRVTFSGKLASFFQTTFSGFIVEFENAVFVADLTYFRAATFRGSFAKFNNATFGGGTTAFNKAVFKGSETSFEGTTFSGSVYFNSAKFTGLILSFEDAKFSGRESDFAKAEFRNSYYTIFLEATFDSNTTSFYGTVFSKGSVTFLSAIFSGDKTYFNEAVFDCKSISFKDATFSGRNISFDAVAFSGLEASFNGATFGGPRTTFSKAQFTGASISFENPNLWHPAPLFDWDAGIEKPSAKPKNVHPQDWPPQPVMTRKVRTSGAES